MSATTIAARPSPAPTPENRTLVSAWLFAICCMIWVMAGIGGFTRETGSGLSIMNWDPIIGAIPPLSPAAWQKLLALYKTIPQAQILHPNITLATFKTLFWPEYIHRLWGRLLALAMLGPLAVFWWQGRISHRFALWMLVLVAAGAAQGAIGWFMVASGFFAGSTAVEPWRLSLHFCAAMFLFAAVLWTALTVRAPTPAAYAHQKILRTTAHIATAFLCLAMFAGTFVSGTHAIDVFDPKTGAGMFMPPANYPAAWFADKATVLFNHQMAATLTTIALLTTATMALRGNRPTPIRDAGIAIAGLVLLQFILGVTALVSKLQDIGVAHQLNAILLLAACLTLLHQLRGAK